MIKAKVTIITPSGNLIDSCQVLSKKHKALVL